MSGRSAWQIQKSVIYALLLREIKTRFGKYQLGYIWALLEPAMHVLILAVVFGLAARVIMPGVDFEVFLATGIIPWFLFSNVATRGIGAVSANKGLFSYRHVKPIDTYFARGLLEIAIYIIVFAVFMVGLNLTGYDTSIEDPLRYIEAWLALIFLATGWGCLFFVISALYDEFEKIGNLIVKPMYFMSGIFFTAESIPSQFVNFFMINPVLHFMELSRSAYFQAYDSSYGSMLYIVIWGGAMWVSALWIYSLQKERMLAK